MDAPSAPRSPRQRTPERILAAALDHFNRYGEPQVSTHLIAAAMRISSGNLHYHFHTKDDLILALFERYEQDLRAALDLMDPPGDRSALLHWLAALFNVHWRYRFLLRDLSSLLTRHLALEQRLPPLFEAHRMAIEHALNHLGMVASPSRSTAAAIHLALVHWITHAFVLAPRTALDDAGATATQAELAVHLEGLLAAAAG